MAGVFAKDTAKEFAEIGSKEIGQVAKRLEQQEFKFTEPVSGPYDNIANPKTVGSGQDFTAAQKKAYYEANMERNGGVIRDDVTGQVLDYPQRSRAGVTPSPNEAQVDHYFPKSEGGMNSSANARIRSREANRAKSNTTPW